MLTTTPVLRGFDSLATLLRADGNRGHAAIVVDPALTTSDALDEVTSILRWAGLVVDVSVTPSVVDVETVVSAGAALGDRDLVVSLGGGSTLDLVKIGLQLHAAPTLAARLSRCGRAGLIHLGDDAPSRPRHVAIPTTLGTGAERSPRACLTVDGHKRLLVGGGLAPEAAVLDERSSRDLPRALVLHGAAEAFLRLAGVVVGDTLDQIDGLEDRLALEIIAHTVRAGQSAAASTGPVHADVRLALATASGWSQAPEVNRFGRDPFAGKGWYIATELSTLTGTSKACAFGHVTAALWQRLAAGDHRVGSRRRLSVVWDRVRDICPDLPADPADGVRRLLARWEIPDVTCDAAQVAEVATASDLRWGRGQPALGAFSRADLADIVATAVRGPAAATRRTDTVVGAVA